MRSQLRSGTPTAHERNALPLLPSGPGGIRRDSLRGAQPSTPSRAAHSTRTALEREFNPAVADCGLQGTATSPSSTIKSYDKSHGLTPRAWSAGALRRRRQLQNLMAEGVGFEPTVQLPVHGISSAAPSATRPPLRTCIHSVLRKKLAEGRGFEPPRDLRPYPISSRTPSTGLGHPSAPFTIFSFERTRSGAPRTPRFARRLRPPPGDSAARRPAAGTTSAPRPLSDPPRRRRRAPRAH